MELSLAEYLKPTPTIDCDAPSIQEKVKELTYGREEDVLKAVSLFYFVRDEIKYDVYAEHHLPEHYKASVILARQSGYCVQKAVLLTALARAAGIPARLMFATIKNHIPFGNLEQVMQTDLFVYHGYNELYIRGKWVKATPTFNLKLCREHGIIPVEFDGTQDAIFHSHNLEGKLHMEYLIHYGHHLDLPLDEMRAERLKIYGPVTYERLEMLKR